LVPEAFHGRLFDVEMQSRPHPAWSVRSACYLSRPLTQQLDAGEGCEKLRLAVGIHLWSWIEFFERWQEEAVMAQIEEPAVREAMARLEQRRSDEGERRAAFVRERALRDERAARREEREEGLAEGLIQGEARVLARLLTLRFGTLPIDLSDRLKAADQATRERWTERILEAGAIEEVFREN
jgi:quinol monooxygenase YgiN